MMKIPARFNMFSEYREFLKKSGSTAAAASRMKLRRIFLFRRLTFHPSLYFLGNLLSEQPTGQDDEDSDKNEKRDHILIF